MGSNTRDTAESVNAAHNWSQAGKALNREEGYETYNVCTGKPQTVGKVIETIKTNLDFPVDVEFAEGTPGDQFGIYGNYDKIHTELHWSPTIDFENGLRRMVSWALETMEK